MHTVQWLSIRYYLNLQFHCTVVEFHSEANEIKQVVFKREQSSAHASRDRFNFFARIPVIEIFLPVIEIF